MHQHHYLFPYPLAAWEHSTNHTRPGWKLAFGNSLPLPRRSVFDAPLIKNTLRQLLTIRQSIQTSTRVFPFVSPSALSQSYPSNLLATIYVNTGEARLFMLYFISMPMQICVITHRSKVEYFISYKVLNFIGVISDIAVWMVNSYNTQGA